MLLSVMESAAANPGVLVIPPVIVPISPKYDPETVVPHQQSHDHRQQGNSKTYPEQGNPLFTKVCTRFTPAEVPTSAKNSNNPN